MSKLFQISEEDLQLLERMIPELVQRVQSAEVLCAKLQNQKYSQNEIRTKTRVLQTLLTNVRWRYGPGEIVDIIPAGGDDSSSLLEGYDPNAGDDGY